jgi:glucose-1-phosphate cytidylyltransferase
MSLPAVFLAGGLGTRLREETDYKPKPMVEIGGKPILWHLMKNFSIQSINEFVVCSGYKSEFIKDYFLNYESRNSDITLSIGQNSSLSKIHFPVAEEWKVTIADTGPLTPTGGRVNRIKSYVKNRRFIVTYGDGLADVDISALLKFHESHGKLATVTTFQPYSRFGLMEIESNGAVTNFREKPQIDDWINIGFFVFEPQIFDYLNDDSTLEQEPLHELAKDGELFAFKHNGFWEPMDTFREYTHLNELWETNQAKWKNW